MFSIKYDGNRGWNSQSVCQNNETGKTKIRLLLQKQSDLGLPCLSRAL